MNQNQNPNLDDGGDRPSLVAREPSYDPRQLSQQGPMLVDLEAEDVKFVMRVYTACIAEVAGKGGDTRYAAINCFEIARQALGVAVAHGIIDSHTRLPMTGEKLWRNPQIPPEGAKPARHTI